VPSLAARVLGPTEAAAPRFGQGNDAKAKLPETSLSAFRRPTRGMARSSGLICAAF